MDGERLNDEGMLVKVARFSSARTRSISRGARAVGWRHAAGCRLSRDAGPTVRDAPGRGPRRPLSARLVASASRADPLRGLEPSSRRRCWELCSSSPPGQSRRLIAALVCLRPVPLLTLDNPTACIDGRELRAMDNLARRYGGSLMAGRPAIEVLPPASVDDLRAGWRGDRGGNGSHHIWLVVFFRGPPTRDAHGLHAEERAADPRRHPPRWAGVVKS